VLFGREFENVVEEPTDRPEVRALEGAPRPALNLYESESEYVLTTELPGIDPESIELEVTDDVFAISGDRPEAMLDEEQCRRQERWSGPWRREIRCPKRIDPARVSAEMRHGVLVVRLAKAVDQRPRKVDVRRAAD
jgi:HSP20 family protein